MGRLISAHLSNKRKWEDDAETEEDRKEEKGREFSIREIVRHCIWAMAEMTLHSSSLAVHLLLDYNLASVLIKLLRYVFFSLFYFILFFIIFFTRFDLLFNYY